MPTSTAFARIHLVPEPDGDRTVHGCSAVDCDLVPDDHDFDRHVRDCPVVGWIERGRKFHDGKVEWRFTAAEDNAPTFLVRRGNYSAAFHDARGHVTGVVHQ